MNNQLKITWLLVFLTLISLRLIGADAASPQAKKEFVKNIQKEFAASPNGKVQIINKYGSVDIKTWDDNRVKIDIQIIVNAANQERADLAFDRIDINFSNPEGLVRAATVILPKKKSYWKWFSYATGATDFSINYVVHMPKTNSLDMNTKYCDATTEFLESNAKLYMKYGDFNCEGFAGNLNVNLKYGNGKVTSTQNVQGELGYGRLDIETCADMSLDSKYSHVSVRNAEDLDIESKYDNYKLGVLRRLIALSKYDDYRIKQIDDITFKGDYSDLRIDLVINNADLNLDYGDAIIYQLENGFGIIDIDGDYADFRIGTEATKSYCVDVKTSYGDIRLPNAVQVTNQDKSSNSKTIEAFIGSQTCSSKIRGVITYGDLKILR